MRGPLWPWLASVGLCGAFVATDECLYTPQRARSADSPLVKHEEATYKVQTSRWVPRPPPPRTLPPIPTGAVRVTGRVVDADTGAPIDAAEVVFAASTEQVTATDRDGRYFIDVRPGRYRIFARGDRVLSMIYRSRDERAARSSVDRPRDTTVKVPSLDIDAPLSDVELDVVPAAILRGVVHDHDGRPVPGAVVRARMEGSDDVHPVGGTDEVETSDDGSFELRVAARRQQLEATHPAHGITASRPVLDLDPGGEYDLDLELVPGCVIEGRVVRADGKVTGGVIERAAGSGAMAYSGASRFGDDGRFRFFTDERATILLRAGAWSAPVSDAQRFECHDGARYHDVIFRVPSRTPSLSGTLRSATGAAVAFAIVDVTSVPLADTATIERTDALGNWAVYDLPPGEYQAVARVPGKGAATIRTTAPASAVELRLSGTGTITGSAHGMIDGLLTIAVDCPHEGTAYGGTIERFVVEVSGGSYRAEGLPACRASIVAERGPWRSRPAEIDIVAGNLSQLDLDLKPVTGRDIFGRVVGADGKPMRGAVVSIRDQSAAATAADEHGRFYVRAPQHAILDVSGAGLAVELRVPSDSTDAWDVEIPLAQ